jgi:hypothetical protein
LCFNFSIADNLANLGRYIFGKNNNREQKNEVAEFNEITTNENINSTEIGIG